MTEMSKTAGRTAITHYDYQGSPISFSNGESVMVNATQMAKSFGKEIAQWFDNPSTHEFIETLAVTRGIVPMCQKKMSLSTSALAKRYPTLVKVVRGGTPGSVEQGTWMHEDVAIEFARWLSPKFAIWCNDRIKELAREGVSVISDDDAVIAHAMQVLQKRLDAKQTQLQAAHDTIEAQEQEIKTLAPMANYTREVLQSDSTYTFTQISKDLEFTSVHKFLDWAKGKKILYYQSKQWLPTASYSGRGWFDTRTCTFVRADQTIGTSMTTVVTEAGRAMLHKLVEQSKEERA